MAAQIGCSILSLARLGFLGLVTRRVRRLSPGEPPIFFLPGHFERKAFQILCFSNARDHRVIGGLGISLDFP
jgi:hypothetical protein